MKVTKLQIPIGLSDDIVPQLSLPSRGILIVQDDRDCKKQAVKMVFDSFEGWEVHVYDQCEVRRDDIDK